MQQDVAQSRTTVQSRPLDIEAFTVTPMLPACGGVGKVSLAYRCDLVPTVVQMLSGFDALCILHRNTVHPDRHLFFCGDHTRPV
jgi:hypothetical protein